MSNEDTQRYIEKRLRHFLVKVNEVRPGLINAVIETTAKDIIHYIKKG